LENSRKEPDCDIGFRKVFAGGFAGWAKLGAGILAIVAFAHVLARGMTPPGPAGEVFRHNQRLGLDATPLFYTEVEDFPDLEHEIHLSPDN